MRKPLYLQNEKSESQNNEKTILPLKWKFKARHFKMDHNFKHTLAHLSSQILNIVSWFEIVIDLIQSLTVSMLKLPFET